MDFVEWLATSYGPGHNFWPGSRFSWFVRGTFAFLVIAGPQLAAGATAILLCLRLRREVAIAAGLAIIIFTFVLWPEVLGIYYRDGDRPWFIGLIWGRDARPWIAAATAAAALAVSLRPRPATRGFPIES
jgi:hypothetical protein